MTKSHKPFAAEMEPVKIFSRSIWYNIHFKKKGVKMILESRNPIFGGWNGRATIRKHASLSSQKNPVLFIDGEPVSPRETAVAEMEVVKASAREVELLKKGGYIE
jgi:hypothetical protein